MILAFKDLAVQGRFLYNEQEWKKSLVCKILLFSSAFTSEFSLVMSFLISIQSLFLLHLTHTSRNQTYVYIMISIILAFCFCLTSSVIYINNVAFMHPSCFAFEISTFESTNYFGTVIIYLSILSYLFLL